MKSRVVTSLAIVAAVFALYSLLGFVAAPRLIQRTITDYAAEQLDRKASVGKVRVNPFLLRLELKDVALAERDGTPIVGFGRLFVDIEVSSLARWAWTLSEVVLEQPALRADIGPDGRLNLAILLEKLPKTERRPGEKLPRLLLRRIVLSNGTITLSDRSGPTPASTVASPINLDLRDVSTLPDQRGEYTVSARLADGGTFQWRGAVTLEPLASQGEVKVAGVRPLTAWRFLQDELNVAEPRGEVDFSARYRAAYADAKPRFTLEDVRVAGRGVVLAAADAKEPLLELASVSAEGGRFDFSTRELVIPGVEVRGGTIAVEVDRSGVVDWLNLIKAGAGGKPEPQVRASREPWKARVESLKVAGLALRYIDRSRARPIRADAKDVAVVLAAAFEGRPDGMQVALDSVAVTVTSLAVGEPGAAEPLAEFNTVALEGASLDLAERHLGAGRVTVRGGLVKLARDKSGPAGVLAFVARTEGGLLRREVAGAVEEARAEGRPWRFALDSLDAKGTRIAARDTSFGEPIAYDGEVGMARVLGFRSDGKEPVKFEASVRFAQGGSIAATGAAPMSGDGLTARVKVDGFNLKPLRSALLPRVQAEVESGALSAEIKADYRERGGRTEIRGTGQARLDNLRITESAGGERLLGWKSLSASGIALSLGPDNLTVDEVRLTGLDAKVVIFKDRSVNLAKALTVPPEQAASAAKPAAGPVMIGEVAPAFPVSVGRVAFEKGIVDFADLSLVLPFSAKVQELEGVVQGISTDRAGRATVRLEGRVDEYGLARANGSLRPFQPTSFLDLTVVFRNVEMPPLSPYSVTFAGRRIASGRLSLDLQYKIDNGTLAGENRIVLEKFTLGERVETPGALDLPLDLAVALLTDGDGKIDLAVPVRGNVNDPQFSYGEVIWQAIRNIITRIVTAPFRALAALFGGGGEEMEAITFDPGRATLPPPEREKLKRLADGLGKRPQIRLVAEGQHGAADRAALQRREVERAIAARLGRPPAAGDAPEPVNVMDAKTQRALEAAFVERSSEDALSRFAAETGKARGKPVDQVNAALALVGKGSADREFYEALLKRLNETAEVPDAALSQLAAARARAVTDHLTGTLNVPADRAEARVAAAPGSQQVKFVLQAARKEAPAKASE